MADIELSPSAQLAIRKHVTSYLIGIATLFGIANVVAILTALYFLVGEAAKVAVEQEVSDLDVNTVLTETLIDLGAAKAEIARLQTEASGLSSEIASLKNKLSEILTSDKELIQQAARFLELAQSNKDFAEVLKNVKVTDAKGNAVRAVAGQSCAHQDPWLPCERSSCGSLTEKSGRVTISMADAGFSETPRVFISHSGSGSWSSQGLDAVYEVTPVSFTLFAYNDYLESKTYYQYANENNYCVSWLALGR